MRGGTNRFLLALVGLVLILAGGAALARAYGVRENVLGARHTTVTDARVHNYAADHSWFWPAVAAACGALVLLALWWLFAQTKKTTLSTLDLDLDPSGATTLPVKALTQALQADLKGSPHVRPGRIQLTGSPVRPHLDMTVGLSGAADLTHVRDDIDRALSRFRQAADTDLTAAVRLRST